MAQLTKRKAYRKTQLVMSTLTAPAYQRQQQQQQRQQEELLEPEIGANVKQEPAGANGQELEQRLSPSLSQQLQRCDSAASSEMSQQQALLPEEDEQQAAVATAAASSQATTQRLANSRLRATTTRLATIAGAKMTSKAEQQQQLISNNQSKQPGKLMDAQQMHVCRLCDKLLSSSSSLDRHMLTHSGERPFVCKRCHMTFTTNGNMHRHMRTHLHKDSLARQQLEQQQLKSLSAGVASISSSVSPIANPNVGQLSAQSNLNNNIISQQQQQQQQQAKLLQHSSYSTNNNNNNNIHIHNHNNHQQEIGASSSPLSNHHHHHHNHNQQQQQQHQANSVTALLNQQLVEAFKRAPSSSIISSGRSCKQQPEASASPSGNSTTSFGTLKEEIALRSISSPSLAAAQAGQQPAGVGAQKQANYLQQRPIDTKALMIGPLQRDQLGLDPVKAVMLAAAAAAAAAAVSQQQQLFPLARQPEAREDEFGSSSQSKQQQESQLRGREKRRKQVNPRCSTRSSVLSLRQTPSSLSRSEQEALDSDCEGQADVHISSSLSARRPLSGDGDNNDNDDDDDDHNEQQQDQKQQRQPKQEVSLAHLIGAFERMEEAEAGEDSQLTNEAQENQEDEEELQAESVKRETDLEDFNNNNNNDDDDDEASGQISGIIKREQMLAGPDGDEQDDGDGDDDGIETEMDLERPNLSAMSMMGSDDEVSNSASTMSGDIGGDNMANMNSSSSMIGDDNDDDDDDDDGGGGGGGGDNSNADEGNIDCKQELLLSQQHRHHQLGTNGNGNNDIGRQLAAGSPNSTGNNRANQQQQPTQQAQQQTLPSPLTTVNGEIIEDISQSYVKTANPNAARKGGKRNRHCYKCKLCTYSSVDRCTLVRHLRIHSGERPYICGICRYAFTTKANCERHVRKRHKKQYNSLGGAGGGGVKGSNGGGRSLIITDHSNHQTIPVKVNPVAAQTISQTLQRIQEKQQQSSDSINDRRGGFVADATQAVGATPTPTTIPSTISKTSNMIADVRLTNNHNHHISSSHLNQLGGLDETSGSFSKATKRKYRGNADNELSMLGSNEQQALPYQRRRLLDTGVGAAKDATFDVRGSKRSHLGDSTSISNGNSTATTLLFDHNRPHHHHHQPHHHIINHNSNSSYAPEMPSTNELFVNLMQQLQQVTNNNNQQQQHVVNPSGSVSSPSMPPQANSSAAISAGSQPSLTSATFLANMLAVGKSFGSAAPAGDGNQQTATAAAAALQSSLLSPKQLSQQFAQLRNLTQSQTPFFIRRNPFDPFNPIDLAAQALDLSCKFQLSK